MAFKLARRTPRLAYPEGTKRRELDPVKIFDIETIDWTEFFVGVTYDCLTRQSKRFTWRNEQQMAEEIFTTEGEVLAHNGGRFDAKWLLRWVLRFGLEAEVVCAGSRIVVLKIGKLKILDSAALFPMSLAQLTKDSPVTKGRCPIPFAEFSQALPKAKIEQVLDYCERDCVSLDSALRQLGGFFAVHDLDLGATVGGSAWRNAARKHALPRADFTLSEHRTIRQAYYGGRVEVYKRLSEKVNEYDINSAYPDALTRTRLPVGGRRWLRGGAALGAFRAGVEGCFSATVTVDRGVYLPPLPCRTKTGLLYPTGTWGGWYVAPELTYAAQTGVKVDIHAGLVFDGAEPLLAKWCEEIWSLRHAAGKKSTVGTALKWYANSLTGCLGMRPAVQSIHVCPSKPKPEWEELCAPELADGEAGSVERDGPQAFLSTELRLDARCHVLWSAYLTAATRIKLHQQQMAGGNAGSDVVYSDTDSVLCEGERAGVGAELGQWEHAGPFHSFEALAPKVYRYHSATGGKVRAKGFPMPRPEDEKPEAIARALYESHVEFEYLSNGGGVHWSGPAGLRRGLGSSARDPFVKAEHTRRLRPQEGWIGGRLLAPNGVNTLAPHVGG